MIEVDEGLNTHNVIRKIVVFILSATKFWKISKSLVHNNGFQFFLQNSNLIFKSKLLRNILQVTRVIKNNWKEFTIINGKKKTGFFTVVGKMKKASII